MHTNRVEASARTTPLAAVARSEFGSLSALAVPIIVTQVSQMGMGVADTVMAGRVGAVDLAGVALGGNLFWPLMLFLSGVIMAVTPSVAQLNGAGRNAEIGAVVRQALWLACGGGALVLAMLEFARPLLQHVGVDPLAIPVAVGYLQALRWGMLPVLGYFALRYLCEGMSWTTPAMLIAVCALLLKLPLNLLFIHGGLGLPAMGGVGCGWASALVMWFEFAAMLGVVLFTRMRRVGLLQHFSGPDLSEIGRLLRLGTPIGTTIFVEMAVFSLVTLLIGRLGVDAVAAHQIAANVGGLTFMIPLAVGTAATIRVGYNVGADDLARARIAGGVALATSLAFAVIVALAVLALSGWIPRLYSTDGEVIGVATQLLVLIAIYQIFDDTQATLIGVLRGYKDTRTPLYVMLLAYWALGLPAGACLGFGFGVEAYGVRGFWIGLIFALVVIALTLTARFVWLAPRDDRVRLFAQR